VEQSENESDSAGGGDDLSAAGSPGRLAAAFRQEAAIIAGKA